MKAFYIIPLFLLLFLGCHEEDNIKAELQTGKYNLTDDPNDPIQHFIYNLYQKSGVVLVTHPDTSDYVYNFHNPNPIHIVAPGQDKEVLQKSIQFISEVFLDLYDDDFKKNYLPFTVLLADKIQWWAFDAYDLFNAYASTSFIAIANINDDLFTLDEATKRIYRGDINAALWCSYMFPRNTWKVRGAFYEVCQGLHGSLMDSYMVEDGILEAREYGFISFDPMTSDTEDPEDCYLNFPSLEMDVQLFMQFLFSSTREELDELMEEYPLIEEKYKILRESIQESINIDIFSFCL